MPDHDRPDPGPPFEAREALAHRLDALDAAQRGLVRERRRARWLLLALLAVVPATWAWGLSGALLALLVAVMLVSVAYYVIWNHTQEYAAETEMVRGRIERFDRGETAPPPAPPAPPRWRASRRRRQAWM